VPHKQIFAEQTDVSHETLEKYDIWHKLLIKWNAKINLVAKSTLPEFWVRHALDSWQVTPYLRVLLKGGAVDEELKDVSKEWTFTYKTVKSLSDEDGCVLIIKNLKRI